MLDIEGVSGVYQAADFIALDRVSKGDWQSILAAAGEVFGSAAALQQDTSQPEEAAPAAWGEVKVLLQMFRGIPMQVRVSSGTEDTRGAMPDRFTQAVMKATAHAPSLIKERKLEELGVRYGELKEVLDTVITELDAEYDEQKLEDLVKHAIESSEGVVEASPETQLSDAEIQQRLQNPDWKIRYAAMQKIQPSLETLPVLERLLEDDKSSIRRLAAVYLGDIKEPEALPALFRALQDPSVAVRRTAGDTLSDLGDPAAIPAMIEALKDQNKLVRWRAARFLYEAGDDSAIPALKAAEHDPEFEVRMQIRMALERIEGGHAAEGSVWQQMTRRNG